ncbi:hypothetical protein MIR68_002856 [Amoeboaphelidium protococcarum]|nr:hypothetical protein MIR68_002856 [Amoeboaphelidium protococcarum]
MQKKTLPSFSQGQNSGTSAWSNQKSQGVKPLSGSRNVVVEIDDADDGCVKTPKMSTNNSTRQMLISGTSSALDSRRNRETVISQPAVNSHDAYLKIQASGITTTNIDKKIIIGPSVTASYDSSYQNVLNQAEQNKTQNRDVVDLSNDDHSSVSHAKSNVSNRRTYQPQIDSSNSGANKRNRKEPFQKKKKQLKLSTAEDKPLKGIQQSLDDDFDFKDSESLPPIPNLVTALGGNGLTDEQKEKMFEDHYEVDTKWSGHMESCQFASGTCNFKQSGQLSIGNDDRIYFTDGDNKYFVILKLRHLTVDNYATAADAEIMRQYTLKFQFPSSQFVMNKTFEEGGMRSVDSIECFTQLTATELQNLMKLVKFNLKATFETLNSKKRQCDDVGTSRSKSLARGTLTRPKSPDMSFSGSIFQSGLFNRQQNGRRLTRNSQSSLFRQKVKSNADNPITFDDDDDGDDCQDKVGDSSSAVKQESDSLAQQKVQDNSRRTRLAMKDQPKLLFKFPFSGKHRIHVTDHDALRLHDPEFLNDVVIEFYLDYIFSTRVNPIWQQKAYVFNSFFYKVLTEKGHDKQNDENRYLSVKEWTNKADVFSRDFLIVPVNENFHWYLAIIAYPHRLIDAAKRDLSTQVDAQDSPVKSRGNSGGRSRTNKIMSSPESKKFDGMLVVDMVDDDDDVLAKPKVQADQAKTLDVESPSKADLRLLEKAKNQAHVIILDSLGSSRPATVKSLKLFLYQEAKHRLGVEIDLSLIQGSNARIPRQPNSYDCGVYLLNCAEQFLTDPPAQFHQLILRRSGDWFKHDAIQMKRIEMISLFEQLTKDYSASVSRDSSESNSTTAASVKDENDSDGEDVFEEVKQSAESVTKSAVDASFDNISLSMSALCEYPKEVKESTPEVKNENQFAVLDGLQEDFNMDVLDSKSNDVVQPQSPQVKTEESIEQLFNDNSQLTPVKNDTQSVVSDDQK